MGSNPAEDSGFLKAVNIHSTISFRGEVKSLVPCVDLRCSKEPYERKKRCFVGKIQQPCFFAYVSPVLLPDDCW
jgi:hypothetical protein